MNVNYENFNIENISPEVRQWYSFPDKTLVQKYNDKELYTPNSVKEANTRRAIFDSVLILTSLTVGGAAYCYRLAPSGKVIRDRLDAALPKSRVFLRKAVPFLGLAIPFVIVRTVLQVDNGYRD